MNLKKNQQREIHGCFSVILFLLFLFNMVSFADCVTASHPRIVFQGTEYDFGIAGPDQKITHKFIFTNCGSEPLKIEKVSADCGCTVAIVSEQEVQAGNSGEITAVFESPQYEGKQEKRITFYSNDPDQPEIALTVKGMIKRDIALIPQGINFGDVVKEGSVTKSVKMLQLSHGTLILNKIEVNERFMTIKTSRFREENSRGILIDITLKPTIAVGMFSEIVTVYTNVRKYPKIDIPVYANIVNNP